MLTLFTLALLGAAQETPPKPADKPVAPVTAPQSPAPAKPVASARKKGEVRKNGDRPEPDGGTPELTKEQTEAREVGGKALGLFKNGEYAKAIDLANRALELDPAYELAARV